MLVVRLEHKHVTKPSSHGGVQELMTNFVNSHKKRSIQNLVKSALRLPSGNKSIRLNNKLTRTTPNNPGGASGRDHKQSSFIPDPRAPRTRSAPGLVGGRPPPGAGQGEDKKVSYLL